MPLRSLLDRLLISLLALFPGLYLPPASVNVSNWGGHGVTEQAQATFPLVDGNYIYDQLFYMATHFLRREAGYDRNLPPTQNGHDEFASYWTQEMLHNLAGFGPQAQRDPFPVRGWSNRPAVTLAFNVEVSVPGVTHPEEVVVIGCHYDGMAFSTQSANDDASGCAIELGIARALAEYWRAHHLYPARTLRFVIFDAEEQGLFGSFHYVNQTVNSDLQNIIAMFNEEQSGISYPLRYLGRASNPVFPLYVDLSPLQSTTLYPHQANLTRPQRARIRSLRLLMDAAVPAVFETLYEMGYQMLSYHGENNQDIFEPIFTPDQTRVVVREDDQLGSSDQVPFTLADVACATLVGNSSYYSGPAPGYPFDQPEDTIQLMNTFADGSSRQSQALTLALALPAMLTTWVLNQPAILGSATLDNQPVAAISDTGRLMPGQPLTFDATASFDPRGEPLSYEWNFGDGSSAHGVRVTHTYAHPGSYTLSLTVSSRSGRRSIDQIITLSTQPSVYPNPYAEASGNGMPPANPAITLPSPDDRLSDRVTTVAQVPASSASPSSLPPSSSGGSVVLLVGIAIGLAVVFAILIGVLVFIFSSRRPA
jgi:hypothetical protein